jgi:protocatechuate 3,4-dioxygenase beta subunit
MRTRRRLAVSLLGVLTAAMFGANAFGQCDPSPAQTEGPYYRTPNPETQDMLRAGDGPMFTLRGQVVDQNCDPIPWASVALWHADLAGGYDNTAPYDIYRATYFADENGVFEFRTCRPGLYPGRTRHMHIKVDGADTNMLTTQLYWPGEPQNASDGIYDVALEMGVTTNRDGSWLGEYTFVLPLAGGCTAATITSDPTSISVEAGATAVFSAAGTGSTPLTFRWYRDGELVENDARVSGATTSTLTITDVEAGDAGTYVCGSHNSCGSGASAGATLAIEGACIADLNGDGVVNGGDLGLMLASWGACPSGCSADLNDDGTVNGSDLGLLLAAWGACG